MLISVGASYNGVSNIMVQFKRNWRLFAFTCITTIAVLFVCSHLIFCCDNIVESAIKYDKLLLVNTTLTVHPEKLNVTLIKEPITLRENVIHDSSESKYFYEETEVKIGKSVSTTPAPMLVQRLKGILKCIDRSLEMEKLQYGSFWLVRNFVRGSVSRNMGCAESITYATNGDYTFFESLPIVVSRWLAPISYAIYTPGYDMNATMDAIQYLRNCLPESDIIRKYVTFHIYFPNTHMPGYIPLTEADALAWPFICDVRAPPYVDIDRASMYRTVKNLTYPINVGRNIARKAANTHFIFTCDVELIPSMGLVQTFLEMVDHNHSLVLDGDYNKKRVFPMPVFELAKNATIPNTKDDLVEMLHTRMAIPFHSMVCKNCHLVPKQAEWIKAENQYKLTVFTVGKRMGKFRYWEPFYISDNREPMFDERVTWEGQSNKRIQNYAMCLLDYEYHVLHPAFLVHIPGIKYFNKKSPRLKYVPPMNALIKYKIVPEYKVIYGNNSNCTV